MRAHRSRENGAAAVETALCLTFIVLPLVFAIISYAYMFSFRQALSQAAAEGARAAVSAPVGAGCPAAGPYTSASCQAQYLASTAVANSLAAYGMTCGTNNLVCSIAAPTTCAGSGTGLCISVHVEYPYRDHSLLPTVPGLGFVLPPNIGFTSSVQVG